MSADPREAAAAPEQEERAGSGIGEQLGTLALAVLLAMGIRAFVVEPFRIPSGSMFPTLLIGDHLFVNKFVFGVKVPFSDHRLPGVREPERGDIVVFTVAKDGPLTFPADRRPDLPREEFVKRIVGLPGDQVEFRDRSVLVNGEPVETVDLEETFTDDSGRDLDLLGVRDGERRYRIVDDPRVRFPPPTPVTVEEGRYFVLGDNRDHSKDSRVWGTVRLAEIKGPAFVLYWSWDFNGSWLELLNPLTWWRAEKRWDRVGTSLH